MKNDTWTSSDPESIPFDTRRALYAQGNLVEDSSFEAASSHAEEGWWRLIRTNASVDIVADGARPHVLRIRREASGENAEPEGAASGWIPVIPGNYDFSCSMKIENAKPYRWRVGARMHDSIDIRIRFYDADKKELDPDAPHPYPKNIIDNGLKILSFANEREIPSADWRTVLCRAAHYPFCDGDVPDAARFVRISIGLRGTGTIWVDDIRFAYSRWNFTAKERIETLLGRDRDRLDLLVPSPKQAIRIPPVSCLDASKKGPLIQSYSPAEKEIPELSLAADYLRRTIDARLKLEGDAQCISKSKSDHGSLGRLRIIITLVGAKTLSAWNSDNPLQAGLTLIQDKDEGYLIRFIPEQHTVLLVGADGRGAYWAAITLSRILDPGTKAFIAADIRDWPDFAVRPWVLKDWKDKTQIDRDTANIQAMAELKMNRAYVISPANEETNRWWEPDEPYWKGMRTAAKAIAENGIVRLGQLVHPYRHFKLDEKLSDIPQERLGLWAHSDPESRDRLLDTIGKAMGFGCDSIMLMSDDLVPHLGDNPKEYCLWAEDDIREFNNLAVAQADMINRVYRYMKKRDPESSLEFCPPYYLNEFIDRSQGMAEGYFRDLRSRIPHDVPFIWCGGTVRSLTVDAQEIDRFTRMAGCPPVYWDNTLYARTVVTRNGGFTVFYPGKVKMCSLIEAWDIQVPADFPSRLFGRRAFTNAMAFTECYRIKYATVADFEWNFEAYDPDESLARILLGTYGKKAALCIIDFNDRYFRLVDLKMRIEKGTAGTGAAREAAEMISGSMKTLETLKRLLPEKSALAEEFAEELKNLKIQEGLTNTTGGR